MVIIFACRRNGQSSDNSGQQLFKSPCGGVPWGDLTLDLLVVKSLTCTFTFITYPVETCNPACNLSLKARWECSLLWHWEAQVLKLPLSDAFSRQVHGGPMSGYSSSLQCQWIWDRNHMNVFSIVSPSLSLLLCEKRSFLCKGIQTNWSVCLFKICNK